MLFENTASCVLFLTPYFLNISVMCNLTVLSEILRVFAITLLLAPLSVINVNICSCLGVNVILFVGTFFGAPGNLLIICFGQYCILSRRACNPVTHFSMFH